MVALINAGANVDSRMSNGSTAMYTAACLGNLEAVKILLQKKANPLLRVGPTHPLDIATHGGHLGVVQELVQRFGADGCADEGAIGALETAAYENHQTIMTFLLDAGVKDTDGTALCDAIEGRSEACLKLLVSRRGGNAHMVESHYTNTDNACENALVCTFGAGRGYAPRMTRFLLDHGADTKKKVRFEMKGLGEIAGGPLVAAKIILRHEQTHFEDADEEGVDGLKEVVRLLRQQDAVHANSWAWPIDTDRATKIVRKPPTPAFKTRLRPGTRPWVLLAAMGSSTGDCGGMMGMITYNATATNWRNLATFSNGLSGENVGGICGNFDGYGVTASNWLNTMSGDINGQCSGGLIGYIRYGGSLESLVNSMTGDITSTSQYAAGGVVGYILSSNTFDGQRWLNYMKGDITAPTGGGGIIGFFTRDDRARDLPLLKSIVAMHGNVEQSFRGHDEFTPSVVEVFVDTSFGMTYTGNDYGSATMVADNAFVYHADFTDLTLH
ncbi:unnamed protein product [Ectocarpus sp. 8 AP-2014]